MKEGERKKSNLICEADTKTEEDAADDQHGDVLSSAVDGGAGEKSNASAEHGPLPAQLSGDRRGEEGGDESRKVQRRREES